MKSSSDENEMLFNVVLVEPEIPNNTGNIGRTCVGTRSALHLVEPLGFEISDTRVKRAGLDYWPNLDWHKHQNWQEFKKFSANSCLKAAREKRVIYFSTKAEKSIFDFDFLPGDYFVFGKETKGLDPELFASEEAIALQVPMLGPIRSHNLANTVSIVLYEALRQNRKLW